MRWLTLALGIWVAVSLVPGISVESMGTLALAGLVLGLVNAILRPVLVLLTLPITLLTLGLFYLIVNGVAFALAAALVPGFRVETFGSAVLGSLIVSVVGWFVGSVGSSEPVRR
jgi:putative membrane protein